MNELMKLKIEREIWPQCISNVTTDTGKLMKNYFDKYKFAELIVQECYVHCSGQLMDKKLTEAHGLTYNDGVMDCAVGLKQHFGVEE
jgi:hypothetical protein